MCMVCIDFIKGSLTFQEAKRNLGELITFSEDEEDRKHYFETLEKIIEEECLPP